MEHHNNIPLVILEVPLKDSDSSHSLIRLDTLEGVNVTPTASSVGFGNFTSFSLQLICAIVGRRSKLALRLVSKDMKNHLDTNVFVLKYRVSRLESTKESIQRISNIANITEIVFDYRDAPLGDLVPLLPAKLPRLNLSWCNQLSEEILKAIPPLPYLDLSYCNVKDEFIKSIPVSVKTLKLISTPITDEGLKALPQSLQHLDLSYCKSITTPGLKALPSTLQVLKLRGCIGITDEELSDLPGQLSSLKLLDIAWCYRMAEGPIELMKLEFPQVDIQFCIVTIPNVPVKA